MAPKRGAKRGLSISAAEEHERSPKQAKLSPSTVSNEVQVSSAKAAASRASASEKKKTPAYKLYKDTINVVDKTFKKMVKSYKPNPDGFYGIVSETSKEYWGAALINFYRHRTIFPRQWPIT